MRTAVTVVEWGLIAAAATLLAAAVWSAARLLRTGMPGAKVIDTVERRWMSVGAVLGATGAGTIGAWLATRFGAEWYGPGHAAALAFPTALVVAFVVRQATRDRDTDPLRELAIRAAGLLLVPGLCTGGLLAAGA